MPEDFFHRGLFKIDAPNMLPSQFTDDTTSFRIDDAKSRYGSVYLVAVDSRSGSQALNAVEEIATYSRRELDYGFVPFEAGELDLGMDEPSTGKAPQPWAWVIGNPRDDSTWCPTVGACCFRWREWKNAPHGWTLTWCWLHPYFRRIRILRDSWRHLENRYGETFRVKEPSTAMIGFLKKYAKSHYQHNLNSEADS
jgi:hypothetical protein